MKCVFWYKRAATFLHQHHKDGTPPAGNVLLASRTPTSVPESVVCFGSIPHIICVWLPLQAVNTSVFIKNQITGGKIDRSSAAVNHLTGAQRGQQLHSSVSTPLIKYEKQNSLFFKHQGHFASIYYLITVLYYEF